ncbi:Int, tyrosine-based site-specific recombinase [Rubrivivax sp. A210]|uniref:phage integrase family protein n=1 Tax=Rubrivivax sp. A210 TaxID=2772301 RepID=UPI0019191539|nr:phage integrase family protein [Rubrivivax sp. A210]CAD5366697.1 Int, tyrosine-based site-specific recombinase [Rubrivivax sp. A210]
MTTPRTPAKAGSPARTRLLQREHFAFFSALLQGVPLERVWDRYLSVEGDHTDLRLVPSTLAWIRAEFAAAAKREDRPGTARLLRLDIERLAAASPALPTLEQFAEEEGLEDEREADQIEAYECRFGSASAKVRKRARLLQRQLAALRWLESVAARDPAGGDALASWLRPELARYLANAGVFTLAQLAERINGVGRNWARSIRGIGPLKSARIAAWVAEHAATIGVAIGPHTLPARHLVGPGELAAVVPPATDIRPLEKLLVPADLDGREGRFRRQREHCLLQADTDYDAVMAWLRSKGRPGHAEPKGAGDEGKREGQASLSHTQRSYRKEAERFMLWAIVQRRRPLSSMTAEDCIEYAAFLTDPQPRARWCGTRARERWSPLWRPFEGPLSAAARRQAVSILKNLYGFLVDQAYLIGNPWSAVPMPQVIRQGLDTSRSLTGEQWAFVREQAARAGEHSAAIRLRLVLDLLYATGLRTAETVNARIGDLQAVEYFDADAHENVSGWMLMVVGKGERLREVPVPEGLVAQIRAYLMHRGLGAKLAAPEVQEAYVLSGAMDIAARAAGLARGARCDSKGGISAATLYRQLKLHFEACSSTLAKTGDHIAAARLARASTHWLRHTHGTHALANGVSLQEVQQNLGHASLNTTSAYVTTEQARRLRSLKSFWEQAAAEGSR